MKLLLVVNPISGGVNKEPFLAQARILLDKYGVDHKTFKTSGKNDVVHLKQLLTEYKPDRVASVGGDGTTLFTSTVLLGTGVPMGIIPLGSANGMAVELFVNQDPIKALKDILMSQVIKGLDMLKVNDEHFTMHIGDVGVNAQVVNAYENDSKRGMATYAKYFIEELTRLKPFSANIISDKGSWQGTALMVGICNARKYGTGVPLNVSGNPMDGKFEIVIIEEVSPNSLIKAGLAKFDESFLDHQVSQVISTQHAEIKFETPQLLQLDGEVIGKYDYLKVEILNNAVQLITHSENAFV